MADPKHLAKLKESVSAWNKWRLDGGESLVQADLSGASLRGASLGVAFLYEANLREADLGRADLNGADLSGANLNGADLRGASLNGADLRGASLNGAKLSGAKLSGAKLKGAKLKGANLQGAFLPQAILTGCDLTSADLTNAEVWEADFGGAILDGAKLCQVEATRARFNRASLSGANVSGMNVSDAHLDLAVGGAPIPPDTIRLGDTVLHRQEAAMVFQGYTPRTGLVLFFALALDATDQFLINGIIAAFNQRGLKCRIADVVNRDDLMGAAVRIVADRFDDLMTIAATIQSRVQQKERDNRPSGIEHSPALVCAFSAELGTLLAAQMLPRLEELIGQKLSDLSIWAPSEEAKEWLQAQGDEHLKQQAGELFDTPGRKLSRLPGTLLTDWAGKYLGKETTAEAKKLLGKNRLGPLP